jgi:hypothetical protein
MVRIIQQQDKELATLRWREELASQANDAIERKRREKLDERKATMSTVSYAGSEADYSASETTDIVNITGSRRRSIRQIRKFEREKPVPIVNCRLQRHRNKSETETGEYFWKIADADRDVVVPKHQSILGKHHDTIMDPKPNQMVPREPVEKITTRPPCLDAARRNKEWQESLALQIAEKDRLKREEKQRDMREDQLRLAIALNQPAPEPSVPQRGNIKPQGWSLASSIPDAAPYGYSNRSHDEMAGACTYRSKIPISNRLAEHLAKLTHIKPGNGPKVATYQADFDRYDAPDPKHDENATAFSVREKEMIKSLAADKKPRSVSKPRLTPKAAQPKVQLEKVVAKASPPTVRKVQSKPKPILPTQPVAAAKTPPAPPSFKTEEQKHSTVPFPKTVRKSAFHDEDKHSITYPKSTKKTTNNMARLDQV